MKSFFERASSGKHSGTGSSNSPNKHISSKSSETKTSTKASLLSGLFVSAFSILETREEESPREKKSACSRVNGWAATVKKIVASGSMRRIKEQMLGLSKSNTTTSTGDIWLLGICYKASPEDSPHGDPVNTDGFAAFVEDFSSRILMTYRKGFLPIGDSKYTSDVNWGCMLRSSQMLVAQALVVHRLGRSWRKITNKQLEQDYIEILHQFGDSDESVFSIHKLLQSGAAYGLAAGSWVGPYAMCRTWESLARQMKDLSNEPFPMAIYIVSGDEDGERAGLLLSALKMYRGIALIIPEGMLIGLLFFFLFLWFSDLIKYLPLLRATYTFPQSLGILGGKPGASTYIVGVQDEMAFYLDPHEVQPVVKINKDCLDADTSSYHCSVLRNFPLDSTDPSLAIGFYCRDKDDFDDFCCRASKLADESDGAPLFTVAHSRSSSTRASHCNKTVIGAGEFEEVDSCGMESSAVAEGSHEDEWQLL